LKKIIIIGGGASGLMAAISASSMGKEVTILERNSACGRKLNICGKGRGNITNTAKIADFIEAFGKNGKFLYSSFSKFFNNDLISYLESLGIKTIEERGGRVFPESQKAQDVTNALVKACQDMKVHIKYGTVVKKIISIDEKISGIEVFGGVMKAHSVIIATGGMSYSKTGSTGDGYIFAKELGHKIISPSPSICPIITQEDFVKEIAGLSLKNVEAKLIEENEKVLAKEFGEMLFTHKGISGPIILTLSKEISSENYDNLKIQIDLKPAISIEEISNSLIKDFRENIMLKTYLLRRLPKSLALVFPHICNIPEDKKVNSINTKERNIILNNLKSLTLTIKSLAPIEEAIVTKGGVCLDEINSQTMESKLIKGLYFAGEVMDIDAKTGGYNLQAAFSTGYVAGMSAAKN